MSTQSGCRETIRGVLWLAVFGVLALAGSIWLDRFPLAAAKPPEWVRDIESFRRWKPQPHASGVYTHGGVTYQVLTGPSGRYLASGPSAYLFDPDGKFVDWTADMGDFRTRTYGFNLMGGRVKFKTREVGKSGQK